MIKKIKLVNFRNFQNREFFFSEGKNYIIGENGKGKTNILESISLLTTNSITKIHFEDLVRIKENYFHLEMENFKENSLTIFYNKEDNKKKYSINKKNTTKKKFTEITLKSVIFSPITMNIFFLGPNLRRDFLDTILLSSYPEYNIILKKYKKSLLNRNKVLKNISQNKSQISEINFWDKDLIENMVNVYKYRKNIIKFLEKHSGELKSIFIGKIDNITFQNISKIDFENINSIEEQIQKYLEKNLQKDIILRNTSIGPHRDDFNLLINGKIELINYASRGEIKTLILKLKNLEINFIEKITKRKPILIIDDLLSELDEKHKNIFLNSIDGYQTFISGITTKNISNCNLINL